MKKIAVYISLLVVASLGCKRERPELPSPTTPVINHYMLDENTFVFSNVTPTGGYGSKWDFAGRSTSTQNQDTVFFGTPGDYVITLTSNSKGGLATTSTTVNVKTVSPYNATMRITPLADGRRFVVEDITLESKSTLWDFGNGITSTKSIDTAYYPFAGNRRISLTSVSSKATSTTLSEPIEITGNDQEYALCQDQVITFLTGGCNAPNGKSWVIDPGPGMTNVGDKNDTSSSYYGFPDGLTGGTWTEGALNNEYNFTLKDFVYTPKNQNVTAHFAYANKFFGTKQAEYADIQWVDPNHKQATYKIYKDPSYKGTGYVVEITNKSYIGFYEERTKYYIVWINEDSMYLAHTYSDDPATNPAADGNARYFTFRVKR